MKSYFFERTFANFMAVQYEEHKRAFYANLMTACKLNSYLADVDRQAEDMFSRLVKDLAEKEKM